MRDLSSDLLNLASVSDSEDMFFGGLCGRFKFLLIKVLVDNVKEPK